MPPATHFGQTLTVTEKINSPATGVGAGAGAGAGAGSGAGASTATSTPSTPATRVHTISVGDQVEPGPDWEWGFQHTAGVALEPGHELTPQQLQALARAGIYLSGGGAPIGRGIVQSINNWHGQRRAVMVR